MAVTPEEFNARRAARRRIVPGDGDPRHGTDNGYSNLRCRCDDCKTAHVAYRHALGEKYPHGTSARYNVGGCRCDQCRIASRARKRLYRLLGSSPCTIPMDASSVPLLNRSRRSETH